MAQSWAESTWEITNYGRFINQFSPNIIRSIRQFERINKKICTQKCLLCSIIYIYIYIYIYILFNNCNKVCTGETSNIIKNISIKYKRDLKLGDSCLNQSVLIFKDFKMILKILNNQYAKLSV